MAGDLRGLNWGSGPAIAISTDEVRWWNSDIVDHGQEHVGSILDGLPCLNGFFDGIVANHSLQALTVHEVPTALAEMHRVLRPGGRLRVLVPDVVQAFYEACEYQNEQWAGFVAISEPWSLDRKLAHYLTWGGQNSSTFTHTSLDEMLTEAGFTGTVREGDPWPWLASLDSRVGESIIMEAAK